MKLTKFITYAGVSLGSLIFGIMLSFGLTVFAQSAMFPVGNLNWSGTLAAGTMTTPTEFSCDQGYTLQKYHSVVDNSSNNAEWYTCTYGSQIYGDVGGALPAFDALPRVIATGDTTTLTWSSTATNSCTGSNFSTGGATSGRVTLSPSVTTTYGISCTGVGGGSVSGVTVSVGSGGNNSTGGGKNNSN